MTAITKNITKITTVINGFGIFRYLFKKYLAVTKVFHLIPISHFIQSLVEENF